jgi:hypothetical protein
MLKGALHIHSTYSDGEFTLRELREIYLAEGCRFVGVSDHADWLDDRALAAYVEECAALSDERLTMVAGLEFPCLDRMHIVGYGVTTLTPSMDPATVIAHIESCGGVSVIAHPRDAHFEWIAALDRLPQGLEVWNSKYDGRYAPRAQTFDLLRRLKLRRADVRALYGQDLHWQTQYRGLLVYVDAASAARGDILRALSDGRFYGEKDGVRLPPDGELPPDLLARMQRAHARSDRLRALLKRVKGTADRLGLRLPARLKAQARRVM